jgi:hypothetical protein
MTDSMTNEMTAEEMDNEMNTAFEGVVEAYPELWETAQNPVDPDKQIEAINELFNLAFGEAGEADVSE